MNLVIRDQGSHIEFIYTNDRKVSFAKNFVLLDLNNDKQLFINDGFKQLVIDVNKFDSIDAFGINATNATILYTELKKKFSVSIAQGYQITNLSNQISALSSQVGTIPGLVEIDISELAKLDNAPADGLYGVPDSVAYRVAEIERHLHNYEYWFGVDGTPSGEVHVADRMAGGIQPFQLSTGADDFGSWVQILGSGDTPVYTNSRYFDLHRVLVVETDSVLPFIIQIVFGESAQIGAKLLTNDFTEFPYISSGFNNDSGITDFVNKCRNCGMKMWARACCIGGEQNSIYLYFGLHEYPG